jgi:hypothetical protein
MVYHTENNTWYSLKHRLKKRKTKNKNKRIQNTQIKTKIETIVSNFHDQSLSK